MHSNNSMCTATCEVKTTEIYIYIYIKFKKVWSMTQYKKVTNIIFQITLVTRSSNTTFQPMIQVTVKLFWCH